MLASLVPGAVFVSVLNDWTDRADDALAGKPNRLADAASLGQFSVAGLFTALGIHLSMSILVGLVLAMIMPMVIRFPRVFSIFIAPLVWSLISYAAMGVLDPTLERWVDWYWFVGSQVAFGAVAGLVIASSERIETIQFLTSAERLDLERSRPHDGGGE